MRSRSNTVPHPVPGDSPGRATRRAPARSRSRRRAHALEPAAPAVLLHGSPEALYRKEKARRTTQADAELMAEAKRVYDEAVAETGKRRAGMRSAVVAPGARRTPTASTAAGPAVPDASDEAED